MAGQTGLPNVSSAEWRRGSSAGNRQVGWLPGELNIWNCGEIGVSRPTFCENVAQCFFDRSDQSARKSIVRA